MSEEKAAALGFTPLARVTACAGERPVFGTWRSLPHRGVRDIVAFVFHSTTSLPWCS
jgi:hypothetical protein